MLLDLFQGFADRGDSDGLLQDAEVTTFSLGQEDRYSLWLGQRQQGAAFTIINFDFTTGALGIHLDNAPNTVTPAVPTIDSTHPFPATTLCDELMESGAMKLALTL